MEVVFRLENIDTRNIRSGQLSQKLDHVAILICFDADPVETIDDSCIFVYLSVEVWNDILLNVDNDQQS